MWTGLSLLIILWCLDIDLVYAGCLRFGLVKRMVFHCQNAWTGKITRPCFQLLFNCRLYIIQYFYETSHWVFVSNQGANLLVGSIMYCCFGMTHAPANVSKDIVQQSKKLKEYPYFISLNWIQMYPAYLLQKQESKAL